MSNEARHNPRSSQFGGPLPPYALGATIELVEVASDAWREAHPDYNPDRDPLPGYKDREVVLLASGTIVFPSELYRNDPRRWPGCKVPMVAIGKLPFMEFRQAVEGNFAANGFPPPAFPEDGPKIEVSS